MVDNAARMVVLFLVANTTRSQTSLSAQSYLCGAGLQHLVSDMYTVQLHTKAIRH